MSDVTNADRAAWAAIALGAFKASHQCDGDDVANIKDLMTDLLHLARREFGVRDVYQLAHSAANMNFFEQTEDKEE
ncbi:MULTISPECIES: hypothetical protein [unclassified Ensifer]|uniref:hypothetical protein n=1 Tax=unclassified Ensifer TaxID=2633371 RepID=UPI000812EC0B|nr:MULTISPECIES: hypothetical protein [unclassified Ensifer]OCP21973.1 hypothetical protein BC361_25740 [Ensifer sp. LC54]OCP23247.1 hypothetical protein BC363_25025 [Ensifer sp. LC384]